MRPRDFPAPEGVAPELSLAAPPNRPVSPHSSDYRADIDGLRAIAVLSVVLFHAGIAGFPGGFVGVDVFFTISGFLIGDQIHRQAVAGRFSFVEFYARRTRRILPALLVMLTILYGLGLLILTPLELRELGRSAVPSILGLSNLLFYRAGDYFAPAAESNPLLMTWSLGVEEQFYVVLPLLMIGLIRFRVPLLPAILLLCLLSFAGSILLTQHVPAAAFYLLPTRAWELGIGVAAAVFLARRAEFKMPATISQGMAAIALIMLAGAVVFYRPTIAFPGWYALIPTCATLMLLLTRRSVCNDVLLSNGPMRLMGLISYSWYLWHWPIFYLDRTLSDSHSLAKSLILVLLSAGVGFVSWKYVETPLRRRILPSRTVLVRYAVVASAMAIIGGLFFVTVGVPQRLPAKGRQIDLAAQAARQSPCLTMHGSTELPRAEACVPAMRGGQSERLLVLGDSHANAIAPGFAQLAARKGWAFGSLTKASCFPFKDHAIDMRDKVGHWGDCIAFEDRAFDYALRRPEVTRVVLAGFWSAGDQTVRQRSATAPGGKLAPVHFAQALSATIARLQAAGKQVILVADAPRLTSDPYAIAVGRTMPLRMLLSDMLGGVRLGSAMAAPPQPDPTRDVIADLARRHPGVIVVDPWQGLCREGACKFADKDQIYYWDWQHLTGAGADAALSSAALPPELR